jgi:hypothetical protein
VNYSAVAKAIDRKLKRNLYPSEVVEDAELALVVCRLYARRGRSNPKMDRLTRRCQYIMILEKLFLENSK